MRTHSFALNPFPHLFTYTCSGIVRTRNCIRCITVAFLDTVVTIITLRTFLFAILAKKTTTTVAFTVDRIANRIIGTVTRFGAAKPVFSSTTRSIAKHTLPSLKQYCSYNKSKEFQNKFLGSNIPVSKYIDLFPICKLHRFDSYKFQNNFLHMFQQDKSDCN